MGDSRRTRRRLDLALFVLFPLAGLSMCVAVLRMFPERFEPLALGLLFTPVVLSHVAGMGARTRFIQNLQLSRPDLVRRWGVTSDVLLPANHLRLLAAASERAVRIDQSLSGDAYGVLASFAGQVLVICVALALSLMNVI